MAKLQRRANGRVGTDELELVKGTYVSKDKNKGNETGTGTGTGEYLSRLRHERFVRKLQRGDYCGFHQEVSFSMV